MHHVPMIVKQILFVIVESIIFGTLRLGFAIYILYTTIGSGEMSRPLSILSFANLPSKDEMRSFDE